MKAIQFKEFGPPSVLLWEDISVPIVTEHSLLIKVFAAGVNPIDAKIREGTSFVSKSLILPSGLGFDVCGEVIALGSKINSFAVGDIVMGTVGRHDNPSAYSEYCLATPEDIIVKPSLLEVGKAAALPIAGLTAWQAVHRCAKIQKGERVLIQAAAGGVGHLAVQFAKLIGVTVIATASTQNHEFLISLGVDQPVDYKKAAFEDQLTDIDVVIDLVGGEVGLRSLRVLKPGGRIVTVPTITRDEILEKAKGENINAMGMLAETSLKDLSEVANLVASGKVQLTIAAQFPISEAVKAHELLEKKHTRGKIVLISQ